MGVRVVYLPTTVLSLRKCNPIEQSSRRDAAAGGRVRVVAGGAVELVDGGGDDPALCRSPQAQGRHRTHLAPA